MTSSAFAETPTRRRKRWIVRPSAPPALIRQNDRVNALLVQALYNRGLTTSEEIDDFFSKRVRTDDPFLLAGMDEAVGRIRRALQTQEEIAVFGDFDADGVTATALLVETLRGLGGRVRPYIPHRVDEGYGVNCEAFEKLAEAGVRLVITVDCGIRSYHEIAFARDKGLDIIVTDHHTVGQMLPPALACINPRRPDSAYPFRELAGVGVAYKLAQALLRSEKESPVCPGAKPPAEEDLLDLAALGTVADLVPLVGENRALAARGLARINAPKRVGLQALISNAELKQGRITSTNIGFTLAPRLNAAGRLASAELSYDLLTSGDASKAGKLAFQLGQLNRQRQRLTSEAVSLAQTRLTAQGALPPLLFVTDEEALQGIIGLVAGQLTEAYYRPAVVVQQGQKGYSRGSARSIPEFHITQALDVCSAQGLLVRHGGHAAAAGFTVETGRIADLQAMLQELAAGQLAGQELAPALEIDAEVDLQALDWAMHELLAQLEPFGYGNPAPLFASYEVEVVEVRPVGSTGQHLKLTLHDGHREWDAIAFRQGERASEVRRRIHIAYRLEPNEWNGRVRLQLNVEDFQAVA